MEGTHLLLSLLWEVGTKFLRRRPIFAKTLSNTSAFTCHRGNAGLALRENKLSVPFWLSRPTGKSESFGQPWVTSKSGFPSYSLLAKPLCEATKWGEKESLVWREEQGKAFREIKRALANALALGLPDVMKPSFFVHL
jgi:hypothetical protein